MKLDYAAMKARWKEEAVRRGLSLAIDGIGDSDEECDVVEAISNPVDDRNITGTDDDEDDDAISDDELSSELSQQISFMRIQATLSAHRQFELTDGESFDDVLKAIHKDVPRTDRKTEFYGKTRRGDRNLTRLRDMLMTFAAYHRNIAYVQGMNDLLARFQR